MPQRIKSAKSHLEKHKVMLARDPNREKIIKEVADVEAEFKRQQAEKVSRVVPLGISVRE